MAHQESKNGWFHKGTGKTFILKEGLCAFLNISDLQFSEMLENGEITEIKKVKEKRGKNAISVEYKGVVYNSYKELCDTLKIVQSTFSLNIRKGLTVEQAIERGLKKCQFKK